MLPPRGVPLLLVTIFSLNATLVCAQTQTVTLRITADVGTQARLRVSNTVLRFDGSRSAEVQPQATVEFDARARTHSGGEVVLTVELLDDLVDLDQTGKAPTTLSAAASGDASSQGRLSTGTRHVVARWIGSGMRTGRVCFSVIGESPEGALTVPIRMTLIVP